MSTLNLQKTVTHSPDVKTPHFPPLSGKKPTAAGSGIKSWIKNRIKQEQIDKYLEKGKDFIDDGRIEQQIADAVNPDPLKVRDIIAKSRAIEDLTPEETATLLNVTDPELWQEMETAGGEIKRHVYDNRIVTFAPLYLSTTCVNDCVYCGFRTSNHEMTRRVLTKEEIEREIAVLAGKIGHKRLIVVYGEHPKSDIDFMVESLKTIYSVQFPTKRGYGSIRRVNVNAPPLSIEALERLHEVGIGTYQVFQETYHHSTYSKVHPSHTLKGNYQWRLYCMHRAFEAGIDDVGIGALFGLYDWKFEIMGLVYHSLELEKCFGIGPHTISFPRIEHAGGAPYTEDNTHHISDEAFRRVVTVLRLAVPHTGLILTARETPEIRRSLIPIGVTQTDASTKIGIGAYSDSQDEQKDQRQQFLLGDIRSLDEVVCELAEMGHITSFCTAGYRCGRTGKKIMELLRCGKEGEFCKLNAVITFREWLDDFASEETKEIGEKLIAQELDEIQEKKPEIYPYVMDFYTRTQQGERDLYF
ncbi:[FeFe] hydrogenase H-cluster radical SAM maturase HydG [candidate division KSB3 bacterium]|uniref:[FeFe] hydrogenase H-cluster radical SAM maturase HydG n=1 Tax=candidate division KSB3 bacterium TaxID=2044937 RepID=A0A2G6K6I3_9BACT|nr:MAG: [FeFe] hydrogenase H-cluster radical SAM maturase HydG [candidate division KSB3 bacterium]